MSADYQKTSVKVVVQKAPALSRITPKSGKNAGQKIDLLSFPAFHTNVTRNENGTLERGKTDFYTIKVFGKAAETVAANLKPGMSIRVDGSLTEKTWKGKDGQMRLDREITADDISLSLRQQGIKSIDFERPQRVKEATPCQLPEGMHR